MLHNPNTKIIPPPKLEILDFRDITEKVLDFAKFCLFMIVCLLFNCLTLVDAKLQENQRVKFFLHFDIAVSDNYCQKYQKKVKEITKKWSSEHHLPQIIFPFTQEKINE